MKKIAGNFLKDKLVRQTKLGMTGGGILIGLAVGLLLLVVEGWIGPLGVIVGYLVAATAVLLAVRTLDRPEFKWNLRNLEKGASAERLVGDAIEYAITGENCAVAHSVTDIARVGDIDHIVATPVSVWVIETKYGKVPTKDFFNVLKGIAANTDAVRQWAPDGTPVRGCLVLAYEGKVGKKNYDAGNEKISAYFTPRLLMHELRTEAGRDRSLDGRIAKDIWRLGQVAK